jgi:hypothetical protein
VLSVSHASNGTAQPYTAALTFLVVSCIPCDALHDSSKLEVLSAHSGHLIVSFRPTYSGEFSLMLNDGQVKKKTFVYRVMQYAKVESLSHLSVIPRDEYVEDDSGYKERPHSNFARIDSSAATFGAHAARRRAVATMISTDDYVTGALVLLWGVVNHGDIGSARCICLVTEGVSSAARMQLEVAGWEIISVRAIESSSADIVEEKWRQQFTKLHLFSLTNFTQILYLDSDIIVKGSLQRAWQCDAPLCGAPDVFHPVFFNCGVLVLVPNRTELQLLLKALPSLPAHESEQSALNEYFLTRFQPLHITLNFQKHR